MLRKVKRECFVLVVVLALFISAIAVTSAFQPDGDIYVISDNNIDTVTALTIEEDELTETPYMSAKLTSQTTELYFSNYLITSTLLNAETVISEPVKKSLTDIILFKTPQKKKLEWVNVIEDVDVTQTLYENRVKEIITVKNKAAPTSFTFSIAYSSALNAVERDNTVVFTDENDNVLVKIEEPFAVDDNGKRYAYKYTLTGDILNLIPIGDMSGVKYPLSIDPSYTIATGGDLSSTEYVSQRKLVRDIDGTLWAVYEKNQDAYVAKSTTDGDSWTETNIADGRRPAITSDSNGDLHVVYTGIGGTNAIRYRKYGGSSWSSEIDISGSNRICSAIAVDSEDNLHVVWDSGSSHNVEYRKYNKTSSTWEAITTLSSSLSLIGYPTIAVSPNDDIHLAWLKEANHGIDYRKYTGGAWEAIENITGDVGLSTPCIAVDTGGNVHLVWSADSNTQINYTKNTGAGWLGITNLVTGANQKRPSITISSSTNVVYVGWTNNTDRVDTVYYTTSWSEPETIIEGVNTNQVNLMMNLYPTNPCTNARYSVPYVGFAMLYVDNGILKYYITPTFEWETVTQFMLTVKARDIATDTPLDIFNVSLDTGDEQSTDNGTATFPCLDVGSYSVSVSAVGYYVCEKSVYLDRDKTTTGYLTPIGGAGIQYAPHYPEFRVQNWYGKPYANVKVNVTYTETGDVKTKNGVTDDNGAILFEMKQTILYQINVSDTESPARFNNKTFNVAPKDNYYNLVVGGLGIKWQKRGTEEQKNVTINVSATTINDSHIYIHVNYSDPSAQTTYLHFYINRTVDNNVEENVINESWADTSVKNYSAVITPYRGRAFKVVVVTEHDQWGSQTWTYTKRFEGTKIDLGLPDFAYLLIAVCVIIFAGGFFGRTSAVQGSLVISFLSWLFWAMGFFAVVPNTVILPAIGLSSMVSILALMSERARKSGVQ